MTELQNALACAQRVFDLIDEEPVRPDAPDAVVLPQGAGRVAFEHVRFRYDPDVPLIEDMNLRVWPGQRIALVGPTGCGKTTLVNLLMRFYEIDGGALLVDDHAIDRVTCDSLRANLGMVLQETWLKCGTVAENIAYGKPDATRAEIEAAAKKARAPNSFSHPPAAGVRHNDRRGRRQPERRAETAFVHCARDAAPSADPDVLDEATSSIDTRTEVLVQDAVRGADARAHELYRGAPAVHPSRTLTAFW